LRKGFVALANAASVTVLSFSNWSFADAALRRERLLGRETHLLQKEPVSMRHLFSPRDCLGLRRQ